MQCCTAFVTYQWLSAIHHKIHYASLVVKSMSYVHSGDGLYAAPHHTASHHACWPTSPENAERSDRRRTDASQGRIGTLLSRDHAPGHAQAQAGREAPGMRHYQGLTMRRSKADIKAE